ncbi:MAG: hypothetical protein JSW03_06750 [Candidatus Eiseniibacteriota bacterium]|nr:MAG: hypothetical protein JSW03_06750 [Candidatus Eisenbacteria bacterium]
MGEDLEIRQAERKVFSSVFDDGLWDMLVGSVVLMFAVIPPLSRLGLGDFWSSAMMVPVFAITYLIVRVVRKRVVAPRIGLVKLGQTHRSRLMRFNVVMMVVLTVGLILGLISAGNIDRPLLSLARQVLALLGVNSDLSMDARGMVYSLRFGMTVLIAFSVAAFFLGFRRLYIYGVMLAVSPLVGEWLYRNAGVPHHGFPVTFGISAAVIIAAGLITFARLMRETSIASEGLSAQEAPDGRRAG